MTNVRVICDKEDIVEIADAVRAKTGSVDTMSLNEIVTSIEGIKGEDIDAELATQDDLIAQISAALEGKTAGGGDLATVTISLCNGWHVTATLKYSKNGVRITEQISTNDNYKVEKTFEADKWSVVCVSELEMEAGGVAYQKVTGGRLLTEDTKTFDFTIEANTVTAIA